MFKSTHLVVIAVLVLLCGAASGLADEAIVQVEEDWDLTIGVPNPAKSSPQLSCTMSPLANISSFYAVLTINQRPLPTFQPGGLQLQLWNGETSLAVSSAGDAVLNDSKERISWTQRMTLSNKGVLTVEIPSGSSHTWGNFGKGNFLVSVQTSLTDLNGYDPNVSATNSGVDFGQARVTKLVLSKVRTYTGNSKSIERALDRVVYQHQ